MTSAAPAYQSIAGDDFNMVCRRCACHTLLLQLKAAFPAEPSLRWNLRLTHIAC
jgi:hypothetical protein